MVIGEVVLGAVLSSLFGLIAPQIVEMFSQLIGVGEEVKRLKTLLCSIEKVLKNADEERHKDWLDELMDVACDMEDLLDEINTERLRLEDEHGISFSTIPQDMKNKFSKLKKGGLIGIIREAFSKSIENLRHPTKKRITLILNRLEEKAQMAKKFGLNKVVSAQTPTQGRPQTTDLIIPDNFYGRSDDVEMITKMLKGKVSRRNFSVITIVGMAGVGKTTLAQFIYNHEIVNKLNFELKSWACVESISCDDTVKKVCEALLDSAKQSMRNVNNLVSLHSELKSWLDGKKLLIVIDDLWTVKESYWKKLCAPLNSCAEGSIVIVTTQNQEVAREINSAYLHHVKLLEESDCLKVFRENAFKDEKDEETMTDKVGANMFKEIAKKCRGVPLTAECLGKDFRRNRKVRNLDDMLSCDFWCSEDGRDELLSLKQAYLSLPSHLKRCFLYFSLFPIDYPFSKEYLAQLWMRLGIVLPKDPNKSVLDLAYEAYESFKCRSLFCMDGKLHDLIRCLACHVSQHFYLRYSSDESITQDSSTSLRHISFLGNSFNSRTFGLLKDVAKLRTILLDTNPNNFLSTLPKLEVLRVLDLSNSGLSELPNSIGKLKHLRCITLVNCKITQLPDSVWKLYNLQTLDLTSCASFIELPAVMDKLLNLQILKLGGTGISCLPDSICKMTSLKVLCIMDCKKLCQMPRQMGNLTGLLQLSNFIVSKETNCSRLGELKELNNIGGALVISGLKKATIKDAKEAELESKIDLEELTFVGGELNVLEHLRPHISLKSLAYKNFDGETLPTWLSEMKYLESLLIRNCPKLSIDFDKLQSKLTSLQISIN